jgi:hypothetical protein
MQVSVFALTVLCVQMYCMFQTVLKICGIKQPAVFSTLHHPHVPDFTFCSILRQLYFVPSKVKIQDLTATRTFVSITRLYVG